MAIGNKGKNGDRTDLASHYSPVSGGSPACATKGYGYSTANVNEVDCVKCMAYLLNQAVDINERNKKANSISSGQG